MNIMRLVRRFALAATVLLPGTFACQGPDGGAPAGGAAALGGEGRAASAPASRQAGWTHEATSEVTRILITNDDGIKAPGLQALYTAIRAIPNTEVKVVAPATSQSGTGSGFTTGAAMTFNPNALLLNGVDTGVAVGGRPADAVRVALQKVYAPGTKPDLVISGFNSGQNPGLTFASGTVGAAQTSALKGIRSIACSLGTTFIDPPVFGAALADYGEAAEIMRKLVTALVARDGGGLGELGGPFGDDDVMLNINFPPRNIQGVRVTRPGDFDVAITYVDLPDGRIAPQVDLSSLETFSEVALAQGLDTDVGALAAGFVTVTPWQHGEIGLKRGLGECCGSLLGP
ncbi:MAG TPA: 5'/3'-nucleotidase SurE [Polyangiaceae bacterium]|nr:5'/3'-nucleotidase SurE [Polyangiaceae bacterium]